LDQGPHFGSFLDPDFGSFWVPIIDFGSRFWIDLGVPILDQKNADSNGDWGSKWRPKIDQNRDPKSIKIGIQNQDPKMSQNGDPKIDPKMRLCTGSANPKCHT